MKQLIVFFFFVFTSINFSAAQDISGVWKTIDDETGEAKSQVTIYQEDGKYFGKVTKILNKDRLDATCEKCSDYRKDQPIQGMVIMNDLEKIDDSKYSNGKILDPNKGKVYDVTIVPVNEDELLLKGGYKIFGKMVGRSQTWYRVQ